MRSSYRETHPSDSGDTTNGNDEVDNGVGEAPENKSFKERIALLESAGIHYANPALILPRVVSGKAKNGPPAPPKNFSSAMVHPTQLNGSPPTSIHRQDNNGEGIEKRQKYFLRTFLTIINMVKQSIMKVFFKIQLLKNNNK